MTEHQASEQFEATAMGRQVKVVRRIGPGLMAGLLAASIVLLIGSPSLAQAPTNDGQALEQIYKLQDDYDSDKAVLEQRQTDLATSAQQLDQAMHTQDGLIRTIQSNTVEIAQLKTSDPKNSRIQVLETENQKLGPLTVSGSQTISNIQSDISHGQMEIANLNALQQVREQQIGNLTPNAQQIVRHMTCVAVSRMMFRFLEAVKATPTFDRTPSDLINATAPQVQGDITTEYARVKQEGLVQSREALLEQALASRGRSFIDRVNAAITQESFKTWGQGVDKDYQRREAATRLAQARQGFQAALDNFERTGDCIGLREPLVAAEGGFWSTRNFNTGPSETLMGQSFLVTPRMSVP